MIKHISSLMLFLFAGILLAQSTKPKIEIPENEFDFGKLNEGIYVTHEFVIKNSGTADLVIEKVRASCGCTAANPDNNTIKPGESTKIKVTFNTSRRIGKQTKHVYVFTNDPENGDVRLTFYADVVKESSPGNSKIPDITLSKNYHNFGDVQEGSILSVEIKIMNEGKANLNISGIKSDCGCITTALSEYTIAPNDSANLLIDFDTTGMNGTLTRRVTILSDDPAYPQKTFSIFLNIQRKES